MSCPTNPVQNVSVTYTALSNEDGNIDSQLRKYCSAKYKGLGDLFDNLWLQYATRTI